MKIELVDIGQGFIFAYNNVHVDAYGQRRVDGTMFDTVMGWVEPKIWFTGPEWMEPAAIVRNQVNEQRRRLAARPRLAGIACT